MHELYVGVDGQTVTIVTDPVGIPVDNQSNTFDYPILTSVTLMCIVTAVDESSATVTSYNWNCVMHFANSTCNLFSTDLDQLPQTQNTSINNLQAKHASAMIYCTATIGGTNYTSDPLILRISGKLDIYNFIILLSRNVNCCWL